MQYMYLLIELNEIQLYKNKVVITVYIIRFIHAGQRRTMAPPSNLLNKGGSYLKKCNIYNIYLKKTPVVAH